MNAIAAGMTNKRYAGRALSDIRRIVVHHTAGSHADHSAESIARYHVSSLGWPGIGYHLMVHWDGRIEYVGDLATIRYNCGLMNPTSVGVVLTGDFVEGRKPGADQLRGLDNAIALIRAELGREVPVVGHKDLLGLTGYGATECPGDWWEGYPTG